MGLATHRRYCRIGDPNCETQNGFWVWLAVTTLAFTAGNLLMKIAGDQRDPGGPLTYLAVRCLVVAAAVAIYCAARRLKPNLDSRTLLWSAVFAAAFLPAIFTTFAGMAEGGASTFFPASAGAAIFFGLLWSMISGNRPPKLAWLGAALAALAIWLLHASSANSL
jgi:drug/metabolite transporter (DMT)-like permease